MTDAQPPAPTPLALAAASFLTQALEIGDAPAAIAPEFSTVKEDPNASIYSVELDSSVGTAAFLIYVYAFDEHNAEGTSGRALYDEGLTTLQQAADRDTPGPRMVAHADTEAFGFILATTPATWRALQGEEVPQVEATESDLPVAEMSPEQRASVAEDLHRTLRDANQHAGSWLGAIRAAGEKATTDELEFTEEETALALFVLDNANVQPLLTALNLLIASAQNQAGKVIPTDQAQQARLPGNDG